MKPSNLLKFLIPLLLAAAIALGLYQRSRDPYAQRYENPKYQTAPSDKSLRGYYEQAQQLANSATASTTASFLAVGDIMLSRNVAATIKKSGDVNLPFSKMAGILKSTDFNFGNLESPISGSDYFNPTGSLVFNTPEKYAQGLADYNFQVISLANNHALDQGKKGLEHTLNYLDENNIRHIGAGKNQEEAWKEAVLEANGIKICFIGASYASVNDGGKTANDYVARIEDIENLKAAILSARGGSASGGKIENSKSLCDFVAVSMHAGVEYVRKPNQAQIDFAHAAIDYGADMVIGGHSHWIQTIEKYQGKFIFYSLGNFIFDQMWSQETREGLAIKIRISKSEIRNPIAPGAATSDDLQGTRTPATLESVELIPIIIENYSTPRPATADEAKKILEKIGETDTIIKP